MAGPIIASTIEEINPAAIPPTTPPVMKCRRVVSELANYLADRLANAGTSRSPRMAR